MENNTVQYKKVSENQFQNCTSICEQSRNGFHGRDIYKGVVIEWDEDHDIRIYHFINKVEDEGFLEDLVSVGETKARLSLVWINHIPTIFQEQTGVEVAGDLWLIMENTMYSITVDKKNTISRIITSDMRYGILKEQKWRCNNCNTTLKFGQNSQWQGQTAHIDHIHPFSKHDSYPNGAININERQNLQALCPLCNQKKRAHNQ